MVTLPHAPAEGPIRDAFVYGESLVEIKMRLPEITGLSTGGLEILSYSLEASQDQATWTPLCGVLVDYQQTSFVHQGLTTGEVWYYRYVVKNAVGWSAESPVTQTYVGT
jgi:hypothetical protein